MEMIPGLNLLKNQQLMNFVPNSRHFCSRFAFKIASKLASEPDNFLINLKHLRRLDPITLFELSKRYLRWDNFNAVNCYHHP